MNKKIQIVLFALTAFVLYIFFLFFVFPYDALKSKILAEVEKQIGNDYALRVGDMDVSMFGNLYFLKVQVLKRGQEKDVLVFQSPKVKINLAFLPLLLGNTQLQFDLKQDKGSVGGLFQQSGNELTLELEFDEMSLANLQLWKDKDFTYKGSLEGSLEFKGDGKNFQKSEGSIELDLVNLVIDPFKFNAIASEMQLPAIQLSGKKGSKVVGKINQGKLVLSEFVLQGGDLELNLKGDVQLSALAGQTKLNLTGDMKLASALEDRIFSWVGGMLGESFDIGLFKTQLNEKRNPQGFLPLAITGTTRRPQIKIADLPIPLPM
ncbi:MAG: type II secretion system protein GspN [Deltaproteobacteria bacterium]|nr:type II secretion system protein GspN [Deltaproteobacteria bacterium]